MKNRSQSDLNWFDLSYPLQDFIERKTTDSRRLLYTLDPNLATSLEEDSLMVELYWGELTSSPIGLSCIMILIQLHRLRRNIPEISEWLDTNKPVFPKLTELVLSNSIRSKMTIEDWYAISLIIGNLLEIQALLRKEQLFCAADFFSGLDQSQQLERLSNVAVHDRIILFFSHMMTHQDQAELDKTISTLHQIMKTELRSLIQVYFPPEDVPIVSPRQQKTRKRNIGFTLPQSIQPKNELDVSDWITVTIKLEANRYDRPGPVNEYTFRLRIEDDFKSLKQAIHEVAGFVDFSLKKCVIHSEERDICESFSDQQKILLLAPEEIQSGHVRISILNRKDVDLKNETLNFNKLNVVWMFLSADFKLYLSRVVAIQKEKLRSRKQRIKPSFFHKEMTAQDCWESDNTWTNDQRHSYLTQYRILDQTYLATLQALMKIQQSEISIPQKRMKALDNLRGDLDLQLAGIHWESRLIFFQNLLHFIEHSVKKEGDVPIFWELQNKEDDPTAVAEFSNELHQAVEDANVGFVDELKVGDSVKKIVRRLIQIGSELELTKKTFEAGGHIKLLKNQIQILSIKDLRALLDIIHFTFPLPNSSPEQDMLTLGLKFLKTDLFESGSPSRSSSSSQAVHYYDAQKVMKYWIEQAQFQKEQIANQRVEIDDEMGDFVLVENTQPSGHSHRFQYGPTRLVGNSDGVTYQSSSSVQTDLSLQSTKKHHK